MTQLPGGNNYDVGALGAAHRHFVAAVQPGSTILELGANTGYVTRELRRLSCRVTAVDIDASSLRGAAPWAEAAIVWDLNLGGIADAVPHDRYDFVLLGDVLEHLSDPPRLLREIRRVMNADSLLVASVPNVAHWKTRLSLLRGEWNYTERGTLDITHMRFFTAATFRALLEDCGFLVTRSQVVADGFPLDKWAPGPRAKAYKRRMDQALMRACPTLLGYQLVAEARCPHNANV